MSFLPTGRGRPQNSSPQISMHTVSHELSTHVTHVTHVTPPTLYSHVTPKCGADSESYLKYEHFGTIIDRLDYYGGYNIYICYQFGFWGFPC